MLLADTAWEQTTGGWPSLLQGGVGSLVGTVVGVLGAFAVALMTTRHELHLQAEQAMKRESVEAANRLRSVLYDMWSHGTRVRTADLPADRDYALGRLTAWNSLTDRYHRQVTDDGILVPPSLLQQLEAIEKQVGHMYSVDYDYEDWPIHIEAEAKEKRTPLLAAIDVAIVDLNDLRRRLYQPTISAKPRWYQRLWFPWAVTGVLALVLLAVLIFD